MTGGGKCLKLLHALDPGRDIGALNFKIERPQCASPNLYFWVIDVMRARTVIANLPDLTIGEFYIGPVTPALEAARYVAFN